MGKESVALFEQHRQNIVAPGGTTWEGDAKDAALDRVSADAAVVGRQSAVQDEAADIAENGGHDVRSAKRAALDAIAEAEADGFRVGQDLSVTDTRKIDLSTLAARQIAADEHAEFIRWNAEQLVQADALVGGRLQEKSAELAGIMFDGEGEGHDTVQLVDNKVKLNPRDKPGEDGKEDPEGKPDATPEQAPGQIGPFPVPKSVEEAAKEAEADPDGKPAETSDVGGTLEDLLLPDEAAPVEPGEEKPGGLPPALSQQRPPSALDQILNQHAGKGDGQDGRYTRSPLTSPIVGADPSVVDRQAARVEGARQALDAAQAELDAAAGQGYSQGGGAGPGRDVTDPLSQAVFDARRELTEQTAILDQLNQAATETGAGAVPIPPLPENADVQAFPPEPSAFAEGSRALSEGSFGVIPDVAKDIEVFTNWDQASAAERTQAVLDAAGMAPIPGAKPLAEGIEHGLDALGGATRHLDDVPTPHADVDPAPSAPATSVTDDGLNHVDVESGGKGAWNYELNNPAPNTHYTVDDRFSYTTDSNSRVGHAEMTYDQGHQPGDRNVYQQRIAGGDDRLPGDHGGHIFGTQFGGPGEAINITAMRDTLNAVGGRDYYNLETQWRELAAQGGEVQVKVDLSYPGDSLRPETYSVETYVDGNLHSTYHFDN